LTIALSRKSTSTIPESPVSLFRQSERSLPLIDAGIDVPVPHHQRTVPETRKPSSANACSPSNENPPRVKAADVDEIASTTRTTNDVMTRTPLLPSREVSN
jgi:hypothetical protein